MTLEQLFERKRARQIFFLVVVLFVMVLLGVRYFVVPEFDNNLSQGALPLIAKVLEDISTTMVVTVFVAALLWWITPPRNRNPGVTVVEPRELKNHFSNALNAASKWNFAGGCGRYFRSAVLETMRKRARAESTSKSISAVILNPENRLLCDQHARYRSGTGRGKKEGNWTGTRVKQELLATILITQKVAHGEGLLDVEIYVADHFSSFRVDLSESCAFETREDPTAPALKCDKGTYYYEALADEYRLLRDQSRKISDGRAECAVVTDLYSLKVALAALGLTRHGLSDSDLKPILSLIRFPVNPYE